MQSRFIPSNARVSGMARRLMAQAPPSAVKAAAPPPPSMPYFPLRTGSKLPGVGLGTFTGTRLTAKCPPGTMKTTVSKWIGLGGRAIDAAANYLNEDEIGDACSEAIAAGQVSRADLFLTSKLNNPYHKGEHVRPALEKTLKDLKTDYVDLYMVHWPTAFVNVPFDGTQRGFPLAYEPDQCSAVTGVLWKDYTGAWPPPHLARGVSIHETWAAMVAVHKAGLAKNIGFCNVNVALLNELLTCTDVAPHVVSCESHPLLQQKGLVHFCKLNGIQFQAYSPLGYGAFAASTEPSVLGNTTIKAIAQKYNVHPAKVVLRWHMQRGVPTMPMTLNENEMRENLQAGSWALEDKDMQTIASLNINHHYLRPQDWYGLPLWD